MSDAEGFDFTSNSPVTVGWGGTAPDPQSDVLPAIKRSAEQLQRLVDAFDRLGLEKVEPGEFASLIVDPRELFDRKAQEAAGLLDTDRAAFLRSMESVDFEAVREVEADLMDDPYMVHEVMNFMDTAPLLRIFSLVAGKVMIDRSAANVFADRERLHPPDFDIDDLEVWDRVLTGDEVRSSYSQFFLTAGARSRGRTLVHYGGLMEHLARRKTLFGRRPQVGLSSRDRADHRE